MKTKKLFAIILLVFTFFMVGCSEKPDNKICISFFDNDYSLIKDCIIEKGHRLEYGSIPEPKDKVSEGITYTFYSWTYENKYYAPNDIYNANFYQSASYVASYSKQIHQAETHKVTFNVSGKIYSTQFVDHKSTITKVPEINSYTKDGVLYTFVGWDRDLNEPITSDTVINAIFTEQKTVKATFLNHDGTVLKDMNLLFGEAPKEFPTPKKPSEKEGYLYKFVGWDIPVTGLYKDTVFTPKFNLVRAITLTFKNYDGTTFDTVLIPEGTKPEFTEIPTKPTLEGTEYNIQYTFQNWDKNMDTPLYQNETFTPIFAEEKVVVVTFEDYNGSVLETQTIPYNSDVKYSYENPTRPSHTSGNYKYTYEFIGWDKGLTNICTHTTLTAQYKERSEYFETDEDKVRNYLYANGSGSYNLVVTGGASSGQVAVVNYIGATSSNFYVTSEFHDYSNNEDAALALNIFFGKELHSGIFEYIAYGRTVYQAKVYVRTSYGSVYNIDKDENTNLYGQSLSNVRQIADIMIRSAINDGTTHLNSKGLPSMY